MAEVKDNLRIGMGFREQRFPQRGVVFIVALDDQFAFVRNENVPHRRTRIRRSRLCSSAFLLVGEMGTERNVWPAWFRDEVEAHGIPEGETR